METYTKKELYKALEEIGSINLKEESLTNILTGKETQTKVVDLDRNYYWILQIVSEDQYQVVAQGSMWL